MQQALGCSCAQDLNKCKLACESAYALFEGSYQHCNFYVHNEQTGECSLKQSCSAQSGPSGSHIQAYSMAHKKTSFNGDCNNNDTLTGHQWRFEVCKMTSAPLSLADGLTDFEDAMFSLGIETWIMYPTIEDTLRLTWFGPALAETHENNDIVRKAIYEARAGGVDAQILRSTPVFTPVFRPLATHLHPPLPLRPPFSGMVEAKVHPEVICTLPSSVVAYKADLCVYGLTRPVQLASRVQYARRPQLMSGGLPQAEELHSRTFRAGLPRRRAYAHWWS